MTDHQTNNVEVEPVLPVAILKHYWGDDWYETYGYYPKWERLEIEQREELRRLLNIWEQAQSELSALVIECLPEEKNVQRGDPNEIYEAQGYDQAIVDFKERLGKKGFEING